MTEIPLPAGRPKPFLTALVRARKGGAAAAAETLLSLAAQTSQDFEVVVLVETAGDAEIGDFEDLVESFDGAFSVRVRVVGLGHGGERSALSAGVDAANGAFIAVIDPDDVVFAHWVESFAVAGARSDGRVLRSIVATQRFTVSSDRGQRAYTSIDRPRCPWPGPFDVLGHLDGTPGPIFGLAIPTALADWCPPLGPSGPELEDWAVVLNAALGCGVTETGEVTYLRRLVGDEQDMSGHTDDAGLEEARRVIISELDRRDVTMPAGNLVTLKMQSDDNRALRTEVGSLRAELDQAKEESDQLVSSRAEAARQVEEMRASASWRLSMPVRVAGRLARQLRHRA